MRAVTATVPARPRAAACRAGASAPAGRPVLYCDRTIKSFLRRQQKNSKNVQISMEQVAGRRVMVLDEVAVRRVDAILNTEATVAA